MVGGLLLEISGRIRPSLRAAVVSTALFGVATLGFAVTKSFPLAILLLVIGGAANLASMSIGQTVVQLMAPAGQRGQVIGLYGMSASGLRFGSGITVGLASGLIGVHWSLGLSSAAVCVGSLLIALYAVRARGSAGVVAVEVAAVGAARSVDSDTAAVGRAPADAE